MGLLQATQRTIAALRKADALTSTQKVQMTSSSTFNMPNMLTKNGGVPGVTFNPAPLEELMRRVRSSLYI